MKKFETAKSSDATVSRNSCSRSGGCGVPGMCPGQALLLAFLVGWGISHATGVAWLTPVIMVGLGFVLISGIWRRFLIKRGNR